MNDFPIEELDQVKADTHPHVEYNAPCIETVLTPDEMAREVLYAGLITRIGIQD